MSDIQGSTGGNDAPNELVGIFKMQNLPDELLGAWFDISNSPASLPTPFFSPYYSLMTSQNKSFVYVAVLGAKDNPTAFFPFQFRSRWHRLLRFAEVVGGNMTDVFGVIARPGVRLNPDELLRLSNLRSLSFTHLADSQREIGLVGEQPSTGLQVHLEPTYWDELRRQRPSSVRELDRLIGKLGREVGTLRFHLDDPEREVALRRLIDKKGQQYLRTGRSNLFTPGWTRGLLKSLVNTREPGCFGLLSSLYAGDTWIASHFGLRHKHVLHYWFPVYNRDLKRYSPGRILEHHILKQAPQNGINVIDHGLGDTPAKRFFANREYSMYRGLYVRPGAASPLAHMNFGLEWRVDKVRSMISSGEFSKRQPSQGSGKRSQSSASSNPD